jgi:hypothetical protein
MPAPRTVEKPEQAQTARSRRLKSSHVIFDGPAQPGCFDPIRPAPTAQKDA